MANNQPTKTNKNENYVESKKKKPFYVYLLY